MFYPVVTRTTVCHESDGALLADLESKILSAGRKPEFAVRSLENRIVSSASGPHQSLKRVLHVDSV